jgi:hypothetical protein
MVKCFVPTLGSGNGNLEVSLDLVLPDEIIQAPGPETGFKDRIFSF